MSFLDLWIWGHSGIVLRSGGGINSKRRRLGLTLTVTEMWFVSLMFGCLLPPPRPPLCISLPAVGSDTLDQTNQTRRQIRPNPRKKTNVLQELLISKFQLIFKKNMNRILKMKKWIKVQIFSPDSTWIYSCTNILLYLNQRKSRSSLSDHFIVFL